MPGKPPSEPGLRHVKKTGEPKWLFRRWIVFPAAVYCAYEIDGMVQAAIAAHDSETMRLGIKYLAYLFAALVLGYSGLATVQDAIAIWRTGTGRPYADPAVSIAAEADQVTPQGQNP